MDVVGTDVRKYVITYVRTDVTLNAPAIIMGGGGGGGGGGVITIHVREQTLFQPMAITP